MNILILMILGIFLTIVGVGWAFGSAVVGLIVALIVFGVWGIWIATVSPIQLQPVPLISLVIGVVILIFKAGEWL